jgi:hypothetical protein
MLAMAKPAMAQKKVFIMGSMGGYRRFQDRPGMRKGAQQLWQAAEP